MVLAAAVLSGCRSTPDSPPLEPLPMKQAIGLVNANTSKADGTVRAIGNVDGSLTLPEGKRRGYSLDGTMFFLSPNYVRFDLKKLGERQFLFGSNNKQYWFFDRDSKDYVCGRHGDADAENMPIRADQIADALGLRRFAEQGGADSAILAQQRVTDEYQVVRVREADSMTGQMLVKEFWLDRRPPRLVRRVVFREADGTPQLESRLSNYKQVGPDGLLLPHEMVANWPKKKAHMRFRVSKWSVMPEVGADGPQFAAPADCKP